MTREKNPGPLDQRQKAYIAARRVARVATVTASGAVHAVPLCPVFDGDRTVYIDVGPRSVIGQSLRRPGARAAVLFDEYFEDWSKLRGVTLHCRARPLERGEEWDRAWRLIAETHPQHKAINWRARQVVALEVEESASWGLERL